MPVIKFSEEWDKLKPENRKPGMMFTTMRGYDARKEMYYWNFHGKEFDVHLKGKWIGIAKLESLAFYRPSEIPLDFLEKDIRTGITEEEVKELFRSFYGNSDPYCIVLWFNWVSTQEYLDRFQEEEETIRNSQDINKEVSS